MFNLLTSSVVDHGFKPRISGVMFNLLTSSVVDHGFEPLSVV